MAFFNRIEMDAVFSRFVGSNAVIITRCTQFIDTFVVGELSSGLNILIYPLTKLYQYYRATHNQRYPYDRRGNGEKKR